MIDVNDSNFEQEVLQSDIPVVVDFHAPWCGPCKMLGPVLEAVAAEYEGKVKFVKFDVDESQDIAAKIGIRGVPTVVAFNAGVQGQSFTGARPKQAIVDFVNKLV